MSPSTIQLLASSNSSQGPFRNASIWSIHVKIKCSLTSGTLSLTSLEFTRPSRHLENATRTVHNTHVRTGPEGLEGCDLDES